MFVIGNGNLIFLGAGVVVGLAAYPSGRAILRGIWNKIVKDVGNFVHAKTKSVPPVKDANPPAPAATFVAPAGVAAPAAIPST